MAVPIQIMALYDSAKPNPAGHRDVSIDDVKLPVSGYRLIDVREPHEYVGELAHIAGSELVPMNSVMAKAADWKKDEPLLFVCKSGGRSANVAAAMTRAGFSKAMNLVGGMLAWNSSGKPVEK
ncbi:MAG: rhodanese-like domain-containing protein [Archangium sp.]